MQHSSLYLFKLGQVSNKIQKFLTRLSYGLSDWPKWLNVRLSANVLKTYYKTSLEEKREKEKKELSMERKRNKDPQLELQVQILTYWNFYDDLCIFISSNSYYMVICLLNQYQQIRGCWLIDHTILDRSRHTCISKNLFSLV